MLLPKARPGDDSRHRRTTDAGDQPQKREAPVLLRLRLSGFGVGGAFSRKAPESGGGGGGVQATGSEKTGSESYALNSTMPCRFPISIIAIVTMMMMMINIIVIITIIMMIIVSPGGSHWSFRLELRSPVSVQD